MMIAGVQGRCGRAGVDARRLNPVVDYALSLAIWGAVGSVPKSLRGVLWSIAILFACVLASVLLSVQASGQEAGAQPLLSDGPLPPSLAPAMPPPSGTGPSAILGFEIFSRVWTADIPGAPQPFDGLGPHFTARSCVECHQASRKGRQISANSIAPSTLFGRIDGQGQILTDRATVFEDPNVRVRDGRIVDRATNLAFSADDLRRRVAPSMIPIALIDAVPDAAILALADPNDRDGDGVRGIVSRPLGPDGAIGRYGWKAQHAGLNAQIRAAFANDIGIEATELAFGQIEAINRYLLTLSNGGRDVNADAAAGRLGPTPPSFNAMGCAACHADNAGVFSDLLLHDLGAGLADPFGINARYWRTAPLADLSDAFAQGAFLHDGRAATLDQAVDWHGGEAAGARQRWRNATPMQRQEIYLWLTKAR